MLAGVNKRPQYGLERSTLKSRLGSVVDLQEGEEIEYIRKGITRDVKKLLENNIHKLRNHFNNCDKHQTGYVSQKAFRDGLALIGCPIEAAMFTVPGMWKEERNIFPVDGNEGIRGGPFKENLYWLQDRQAGQAVPDVSHGHVLYNRWLQHVLHPEEKEFEAGVMKETGEKAAMTYELWRLVCHRKSQLLVDFWSFDKEKLGHITVDDFEQALRVALQISHAQAQLLLETVPFKGRSGWIDYRRWIAEFCRSPEVNWQAYGNVSLLAQSSRELDMEHAEHAAKAKALTQHHIAEQTRHAEELYRLNHEHWQHEQTRKTLHYAPTVSLIHQHPQAILHPPERVPLPFTPLSGWTPRHDFAC